MVVGDGLAVTALLPAGATGFRVYVTRSVAERARLTRYAPTPSAERDALPRPAGSSLLWRVSYVNDA